MSVVFPPDAAYVPLHCGTANMTDRQADQPTALNELDLVGTELAPTGLRASDATNLYLRIRLDKDPAPNGKPVAAAWGMAFDLDGDLTNYEVLVMADGVALNPTVGVFANNTTTIPNALTDPADQPVAASFAFAMNARSLGAGSSEGGTPDFFLDFAVPWSALVPLGLDRNTPTHVWAASSTSETNLDGDVACHDGATGGATLTGTTSAPTTGDPAQDPTGLGQLRGGEGCAVGGSSPAWFGLALVGLVRRTRSRASRRRSDRG